jgi:hypothetical protein
MGVIRDSIDRLLGVTPQISTQAPQTQAYREAAGVTVDKDDDQWRRLSGRTEKDLNPITHQRAIKQAKHLWESNMLANRLVELPLAYLLGKGVRLTVADEEAQAALDLHWNDCINAWPIKFIKRARELSLFGEQCWPVFVGANRFVRIGYLDPEWIETVVMDPDNAEQPIGIVTRKNDKGVCKRYKIIINGPESVFAPTAQAIRETFTDGQCFFFRVNDLCNGARGRPDMLASMDWLDAYEQFLFGELDRADFMRAFFWDVKLTGADAAQVKERAREITPPSSGSTRVHNENEEWQAITPALQAGDTEQLSKLLRNHVMGGSTMPEHWYGGASDVNRATGSSMVEPTEKIYEMRQVFLGHALVQVATFVLRARWNELDSDTLAADKQKIIDSLRVEWPEMTSKDTTRYASALGQVVSAGVVALQEGLLSRATLVTIVSAIARQLGVEIDVEDEIATAEAEFSLRGGKDLMGVDVTDSATLTDQDDAGAEPANASGDDVAQ